MSGSLLSQQNGLLGGRPFRVEGRNHNADIGGKSKFIRWVGELRVIDIEEARANLDELIDSLRPRERFAISVDGRPRVLVFALTKKEIKKLGEIEE